MIEVGEQSVAKSSGRSVDGVATVRLERVLCLCDPRANWPWDCDAPDESTIQKLLESQLEVCNPVGPHGTAAEHLGRVLYLARHGWEDAVEIDVGIPCLGYSGPDWPVIDGNHRVWAATLRGDEFIDVTVAGQVDHAAELLGVTEAEISGGRSESGATSVEAE